MKRYKVTLEPSEREELKSLIVKGKAAARKPMRPTAERLRRIRTSPAIDG